MPVNLLNSNVKDRESRFKYPSPFFDIASTYIPPSIKSLFKFTKYFYYSNPVISPIIYKLSEYPITNLIYEKAQGETELEDKAKDLWKRLLEENLHVKRLQIEINLDFNVYGNAFLSIYYPFIRMLECPQCGKKHNINKVKWKWTNWKFKGICPEKSCQANVQEFKVVDKQIKNRKKIKIVRWNPSNISIDYNSITGESVYTYGIPNREKNAIRVGKRGYIDTIPWVFVEAVKGNKNIELEKENLFHFKRASVSDTDMGWGMPIIFPVIKLAYYLQVLRKGQEAVMLGHIVPLRILFPQQNADTTPYVTMNLGEWRMKVELEIQKWRQDCVDPRTLVETNDGYKMAKDVKEGDLVKTALGNHKPVIKKITRKIRDDEKALKFTVRSLKAFPTTFSPNHGILAIKKRDNANGHRALDEPKFYKAGELEKGDYVLYPIERNIKENQEIDLAAYTDKGYTRRFIYTDSSSKVALAFEAMLHGEVSKRKDWCEENVVSVTQYKTAGNAIAQDRILRRVKRFVPVDYNLGLIVGAYLGDGSGNKNQFNIVFNKKDKKKAERLARVFYKVFKYKPTLREKDNTVQVYVSNTVITQFIRNLCPGISITKKIPKVFMQADKDAVGGLLTGLYDADGCKTKMSSGSRVTYSSSSHVMAMQVRELLLSYGIICSITSQSPKKPVICGRQVKTSHTSYKINAHGAEAHKASKLIGWSLPLNEPRGYSTHGFIKDGYVALRINNIMQNHDCKEVIGYTVKGDETFCVQGIATHNSNYISVMPIPVGVENVGGDARALMITQEIKATQQEIAGGMGVPLEMLLGGLDWSGSSVSLRILENHFLTVIEFHNEFFKWLTTRLSRFFKLPKVNVRQGSFKMADDIQYKQLMINLQQAGNISSTTLLNENSMDFMDEQELIKKEQQAKNHILGLTQIQNAEIQGQLGVIQAKYNAIAQMEAQKLMQTYQEAGVGTQEQRPGQPQPSGGQPGEEEQAAMGGEGQGPITVPEMVQRYVEQIGSMTPEQQEEILQRMEAQKEGAMPQLAAAIRQKLAELGSQTAKDSKENMTPLPEQKPPRRASSPI